MIYELCLNSWSCYGNPQDSSYTTSFLKRKRKEKEKEFRKSELFRVLLWLAVSKRYRKNILFCKTLFSSRWHIEVYFRVHLEGLNIVLSPVIFQVFHDPIYEDIHYGYIFFLSYSFASLDQYNIWQIILLDYLVEQIGIFAAQNL